MRKGRRGSLLLLLILIVVVGLIARSSSKAPSIATGSYLVADLRGGFEESPPEDLVGRLLSSRGQSLFDTLLGLRAAARDERIAGLILRLGALEMGWGKAREIRDAVVAFKRSDKPIIAVIEQEILASNMEYYIASAADRIHLSPASSAPLTGLSAQFLFLGGLWDKLDIEMHVEQVREYKTMGDFLAGKQMTAAHREMADAILDGIDAEFIGAIAKSRQMEPEALRALIDEAPASPAQFKAAGLSDGVQYLRTVHDSLGGEQAPLVQMSEYAEIDVSDLGLNTGKKIGVLYATGNIVTGKSASGPSGSVIGADSIAEALEAVAEDDEIVALVMRIDSPGGSALASDLIWRARRAVQDRKPVVVSMSDVAASGGYYIAAGANRIVAQPTTLTGSIGVVLARPVFDGLLANAGIHVETLQRGKFAHLGDLTVSLDEASKAKLVGEVEHIYTEFVERVAAGRSMTTEEVDAVGRGRVWTGTQALENGLIDELGGFWDAVNAAKRLVEIDVTDEVELVFFPQPQSLSERVAELLGARTTVEVPEPFARIAALAMPPFAPGAVLALMPYAIDVR